MLSEKHNLELPKLVSIVTDGVPSMIGSKNCTVPLLYKYTQELGLQNELKHYN
jgi:hypothetical protein